MVTSKRIQRLSKSNEVARDQPRSLGDELIKRVLSVGTRLAPVDRPRVIFHGLALARDGLAVAFHHELLQIGGKALQILFIWKNRNRLRAKEIVIPDRQQPHDHRKV